MFEIGCKIVCVDDKPCIRTGRTVPIQRGNVYVVRDVEEDPYCGGFAVRLVGIFLEIHPLAGVECGFCSTRFRRLADLKSEARNRQKQEQPVEV